VTFLDFEEFIASFNEHRVRYLIVGGYAVGFHARPRATKDIDILLDRTLVPSFSAAWKRRVDASYGSAPAHYISLSDLIASKVAAGRPQDLADVDVLRRALRKLAKR
jgi:hypothetical protein